MTAPLVHYPAAKPMIGRQRCRCGLPLRRCPDWLGWVAKQAQANTPAGARFRVYLGRQP